MSLSKYKEKRNFGQTKEPEGAKAAARGAAGKAAAGAKAGRSPKAPTHIFVVQRHLASRLHYDFRLEAEGVLKSWAIPKGPSMNPADKRLAVMVEDHPLDYAGFSGEIPEGNYGAGIVEIWDKGTYQGVDEKDQPVSEAGFLAHLEKGQIKFRLQGRKLKGGFALVRFKAEDNNWLLIKHDDAYAVHTPYDAGEETPKGSPINRALAEGKNTGPKAVAKATRPAAAKIARASPAQKRKQQS
jgi:bifunctional non-homologous end joining protein LigD